MTIARHYHTSQSSQTHGYSSGGTTGSSAEVIDKFTFASNGSATDVGDIFVTLITSAGTQY